MKRLFPNTVIIFALFSFVFLQTIAINFGSEHKKNTDKLQPPVVNLNEDPSYQAYYLIDESNVRHIAPLAASHKFPYLGLLPSRSLIPSPTDTKSDIFMDSKIFRPDSAVYYVRMPLKTTPYLYEATELGGYRDSAYSIPSFMAPTPPINLPLTFLSNGKPSFIHTLTDPNSALHQTNLKPKPMLKPPENINSDEVVKLNKGPYVFNGKVNAIYLLQDPYNALYANSISNFYP